MDRVVQSRRRVSLFALSFPSGEVHLASSVLFFSIIISDLTFAILDSATDFFYSSRITFHKMTINWKQRAPVLRLLGAVYGELGEEVVRSYALSCGKQ